MLEPRRRVLLFEALQPPPGFRFDQGIGTTYTLDLVAMLTAPLAFTLFEQQDEQNGRPQIDSLEILESLRRHADQLTLFCHAGRIAQPQQFYPQLAFIENTIVECLPPNGGSFHPKVWVLRWINDSGEVRYRVLCLSRNLTFSRAWDTLLALDGKLNLDRRARVGVNAPLVDFVRALPGSAVRKPLSETLGARIELLASELERTELELPDGITGLRFWPLGFDGRSRDPLEAAGDRLLVVSPFVTLGRLEELAEDKREVTVVSTGNALACLERRPKGIGKYYTLSDRAIAEPDPEQDPKPESDAESIQLADLHAKLYVSETGWDAHVWTGSANATDAAFGQNVELVVELIGPRKRFGIDALMLPEKGEVRFVNLLEDAGSRVATEEADSDKEALEDRLDKLRDLVAGASLEARVTQTDSASFGLELMCTGGDAVSVESDLSLLCWPVTIGATNAVKTPRLAPGLAVARFEGMSSQSLTSFFIFEVSARLKGEGFQQRFVVNVPLINAPNGRREQVLRSLVSDRGRMLRFLWLLLADEGFELPSATGPNGDADGAQGQGNSRVSAGGLFEQLLRTLDRNPDRLDNLQNLLKELRHGAEGEDMLPPGFDTVWEPIWRQRERLRESVRR